MCNIYVRDNSGSFGVSGTAKPEESYQVSSLRPLVGGLRAGGKKVRPSARRMGRSRRVEVRSGIATAPQKGKPLRRLLPQSTDVFGIHESEYPSRHTSCSVDFEA
jgi:hypothetical protein